MGVTAEVIVDRWKEFLKRIGGNGVAHTLQPDDLFRAGFAAGYAQAESDEGRY